MLARKQVNSLVLLGVHDKPANFTVQRHFIKITVHHIPSYIFFFPDYLSDHALDSYDHFHKNDHFIEFPMTYVNNCLQQMSITFQISFFPEILFKVGGVDVDS
jgi:hypothetical protein